MARDGGIMSTKETLHRLIDELPDHEAERLLQALQPGDPVARSLALAPIDDEPETAEEAAAVAEAREAVERGATLTTTELRRRLGL